ncbi:EpsG family protein [Mediterraneibacter gnavus]|uniref:EpsG family protein n=1 Tax=Mediterraneibacter gnavus TaxID=33038 RepID=UPI0035654BAA
MLKCVFYILLGLNFIIAFRRKRVKSIEIISWLFLIILISGRCEGPDYGTYLHEYNRTTNIINNDMLYQCLVNIGRGLKLEYNVFLFVLVSIAFCMIIYVITKLKINTHVFIFFYMLFTVFYDAIQVNNFIANAICILAVYMKVKDKKIVSLVLVLIASLIHSVSLVYLCMFLFSLEKERRNSMLIKFFVVFGGVLFGVCLFIPSVLMTITYVFNNILSSSDIGTYLNTRVNNGYIIFIFLHLINVFMLIRCKKKISINLSPLQLYFLNVVNFINMAVILFYPLLLVNSNFYRIFRNYNILIYICYAIVLSSYVIRNKNVYEKKYLKFLCSAILVSIIWYHFEIVQNDYSYIVQPILENNYFLGGWL